MALDSYLVYRSQVTVSICESRVDLNGSSVALQRPLNVLHLFESVAHVGVRIRKCGADSVR